MDRQNVLAENPVEQGRGFMPAVSVNPSSGQVAWDANGTIVGQGDIGAQARQVFQNLRRVLQAAGSDLSHLLKITTYITKIEDFPAVAEVRSSVFQGELPASTLIVVKSLFHPDFLLEVEGVAVTV